MMRKVFAVTVMLSAMCLFLSLGIIAGNASAAEKGVLRIGWTESSHVGMNALRAGPAMEYGHFVCMFETLWVPQFDGKVIPWLAKSWEYDKAKGTWTVHLDERARWHDGKPVIAKDVKFSFDTVLKNEFPISGTLKPFIASIDVLDEKTVRFNMKSNYASFIDGAAGLFIVPEHIWSKVEDITKFTNPHPIGSGPFLFKEFKERNYLRVVRNDNYWRGPVGINGILHKVYTNEDAKFMALLKGELDIIPTIEGGYSIIPKLQKDPNIEMVIGQGPYVNHLIPNHRRYPLNIKEVRQAISIAIDRDEIISKAFSGYAERPSMGWIAPALKKWVGQGIAWPGYGMKKEERIKKANEMLDSLGFKRGADGMRVGKEGPIHLRIRQPNTAAYVRGAGIVKENLKEIGISSDIMSTDPNSLYRGIIFNPDRVHDWEMLGPGTIATRYLETYTNEWGPEVEDLWWYGNACAWVNKEGREIMKIIAREMDDNKRLEMVKKVQTIFADDLPVITLCHPNMTFAYRTDKFTGWNNAPVVYGAVYYPPVSIINLTSLRAK